MSAPQSGAGLTLRARQFDPSPMRRTLYPTYDPKHKQHRQRLRTEKTKAEQVLWYELRGRKMGYKWRRQCGIGNFIVDFCCLELKLAIELDGPVHDEQKEYDKARDADLVQRGYKVIRYKNDEALFDRERVLKDIKQRCDERKQELAGTQG